MSLPPKNYPENFEDAVFVNNIIEPVNYTKFQYHKKHGEICLVLSGRLCYVSNNRRYELSPYDMIYIPSNVPHKLVSLDDKKNQRYVIINFIENEIVSNNSGRMLLGEIFQSPIFSVPHANTKIIDDVCTRLISESDYPSLFSTDLLKNYVYELLIILYRITHNLNVKHHTSTNMAVEGALKYIEQNYQTAISLKDVAEFCHVHPNYLSRIFKETMKLPLISYINVMRIHMASMLLIETNLSITEISAQCGFTSNKHFCDVFKKQKGVSATEFRKNGIGNTDGKFEVKISEVSDAGKSENN